MLKYIQVLASGIGRKMVGLALTPLCLMGIVCAIVYVQILALNTRLEGVLKGTVPAVTTSMEMTSTLNLMEGHLWNALANKDDENEFLNQVIELESAADVFSSAIERYGKYQMPERAVKLRDAVAVDWGKMLPVIDKLKLILREKKILEATTYFRSEALPLLAALRDRLSAIELNNVDVIEANSVDAAKGARITVLLGAFVSVIVSVIFSVFLSANLVAKFLDISARLSDQSEKNKHLSQDLANTSENLGRLSGTASSALTQTAAAMEQIRGMTLKIDDNSRTVFESSRENIAAVKSGQQALQKMQESIEGIRETNQEMNIVINENGTELSVILKIFEQTTARAAIINDIVFQTKLLSFNASVEASRAGEHGKGFSVVAEEIGNLASSSGEAAKQITQLLEDGGTQVRNIVAKTSSSMLAVAAKIQDRVQHGEASVELSLKKLEEISGRSNQVSDLVENSSNAISEQARGINEITTAVHDLNQVTQENVKNAQEIDLASSTGQSNSEELTEIALELSSIVA
jgi:methyl-accepting chemotaxis protein